MAKTLNHYSQQIKALAPDALALDRAKQLGDLLLQAKAAVKAAGKLWTDWLQADCDLSVRTAQRFMTIAKRWNEDAFTKARNANPSLAIREADKVLAASATRKKAEPEQRDPYAEAMNKLATIRWDLKLLSEMHLAEQLAGGQIEAANQALSDVHKALTTKFNTATHSVSADSACLHQEELKRQAAERAWLKENKDEIRERHSAWVSAGCPQGEAAQKWLKKIGPASWE